MKHSLRLYLYLPFIFTGAIITGTASAEAESLERADLWADTGEDIEEAPGYEDRKDTRRKWVLNLGLVGGISPEYEGSTNYGFGFGPNFSVAWRDTVFYKGKTLGVNIVRTKKIKAGAILSWTSGRDEDDDDTLEGLGDVDSSTEAGGFFTYRNKPFRFKLEARQDIGSGHEGRLVELSTGRTLPFDVPFVFIALGTTWASDDYMESFFGVNGKQSDNSGLRTHNAKAGIKDVNISMTSGYKITKRWRIGAKIEYKRLTGDAADSPIIDSENQFLAGIGFSYHMGSKDLPEDLVY